MPIDPLSDRDYERIARFLAGELSDADRAEFERWATSDVARSAALEAMKVAWNAPLPEPVWDVDAAWGKLATRISTDAGETRHTPGERVDLPPLRVTRGGASRPPRFAHDSKSGLGRRWWRESASILRIAAAAVVLIGGAFILSRGRSPSAGVSQVAAVPASFSTASGERRSVTLSDGSTVVLGVSSVLKMRDGYGEGAREVELTGEALFTVTHDEARPFRVYVGNTVVEDLGTEFAVRGYADARVVRVAVSSGSVAIHREARSDTAVVLSPRDMAIVAGEGSIDVRRGVDVSPFTAFSSGRLIFQDTPLSEVAREVERWYGVEAQVVDPSIADKHLTVTFEGETLDEVLRIIGMSLDVRYVRDGNRVEFTGTGYSSAQPTAPEAYLAEGGV